MDGPSASLTYAMCEAAQKGVDEFVVSFADAVNYRAPQQRLPGESRFFQDAHRGDVW